MLNNDRFGPLLAAMAAALRDVIDGPRMPGDVTQADLLYSLGLLVVAIAHESPAVDMDSLALTLSKGLSSQAVSEPTRAALLAVCAATGRGDLCRDASGPGSATGGPDSAPTSRVYTHGRRQTDDDGGSMNEGGGSMNEGGGSMNEGGGSMNEGGRFDAVFVAVARAIHGVVNGPRMPRGVTQSELLQALSTLLLAIAEQCPDADLDALAAALALGLSSLPVSGATRAALLAAHEVARQEGDGVRISAPGGCA